MAAKTRKTPSLKKPATGTYRYDRKRGEVVLVSAGVPKVASKSKSASPSAPPCGGGGCDRGRCPR